MEGLPSLPEFLLVFARLGALCAVGSMGPVAILTWRVRAVAAIMLTLFVWPASDVVIPSNWSATTFAWILAREAGLGVALGIGFSTVGMSVELSGNLMNALSGGTWGSAFTGNAEEETPLVRFLLLSTLVALFASGGHRMALTALLDTYRWMPPGEGWQERSATELVVLLLSQSVLFGLRAAAPMILALLVGSIVVGVAGRIAPAFGQLSLTLGLNVLLLVASLVLGLGTMTRVYQKQLDLLVERIGSPVPSGFDQATAIEGAIEGNGRGVR